MIIKLGRKLNVATLVFSLGGLIAAAYFSTYLFTVTDNAFVVENMTPIAASVSGRIEKIYVENGQSLKKGDPILRIQPETFQIDYSGAKAQYEQARLGLDLIREHIEVTKLNLAAAQAQLEQLNYEYRQNSGIAGKKKGAFGSDLQALSYNIKLQANTVASLQAQVRLGQTELKQAQVGLSALKAAREKAALNLRDTLVTAPSAGYIQNMYSGVGTLAMAHQPLFNFISTANTYIQANFNETDLANVRAGDKVLIFPRTYLGHKVFHGLIMSDNWAVDRQHINPARETQLVMGGNHWLNLPQRLPVQIRVIDTDDKYPLRPGMSAYVYVTGHQ